MGKKKKIQNIQINNENFNQVSYLTADSFALPETFSNVPKNVKQANDKAFDYIRPKDKDDIFEWRNKDEKNILKKTEKKSVPLQKLSDLES